MPNLNELDPIFFKRYESPFSYRYASDAMSHIWSEEHRWFQARDLWIAVAGVQKEAGLVSQKEYDDLIAHRDELDVLTILRRELDREDPHYTRHDVVAGISEYADKATIGKRIIHQGMTSEDLLSNVEVLLIHQSFDIIEDRLLGVLNGFDKQIDRHKNLVCVGYTHLQSAEPTTLGYRFARYARDFLVDLRKVRNVREEIKGKGIKGAVGTSASFEHLLEGTGMTPQEHERRIMERLGIEPEIITSQTYPRKSVFSAIAVLASIGQSCHQFAGDIKQLQASPFAELAEPRDPGQVASSAMPHKQNPNTTEGIKSLSRGLPGRLVDAWHDAAEVTLERGLEDSGNKRSYLPEAFLATDEVLRRTERVIRGLQVRESSIKRNLEIFGPFMALEIVLAELSKRGANRQEMHEILREQAEIASEVVWEGNPNPLRNLVISDERIASYLTPEETEELFDSIKTYDGDAPERCDRFLAEMQVELEKQ